MNQKIILIAVLVALTGCASKPAVLPSDRAYNPIEHKNSRNNNTFKGWVGIPDFKNDGIGAPYYGWGK